LGNRTRRLHDDDDRAEHDIHNYYYDPADKRLARSVDQ
jgi:hypothetical protein